jgi:hypothetical protein
MFDATATNPAVAHPESIRAQLFEQHAALGMTHQPNIGDNGCHASAGPIEGRELFSVVVVVVNDTFICLKPVD